MRLTCLAAFIGFCTLTSDIHGQKTAQATLMPVIREKNGRHTLLVDGNPFFILGGQAHNSSAWPVMLSKLSASHRHIARQHAGSALVLGTARGHAGNLRLLPHRHFNYASENA